MKILSIDVGIKNMSFCLFEILETNIKTIKWDNIDLSAKSGSNSNAKCIEIDTDASVCLKPAKFVKDGNCYCLKHSKKYNYLRPCVDLKPTYLNKRKLQELIDLANKYKVECEIGTKKIEIVSKLNDFAKNNCYSSIDKSDGTKVDLVTVGRNIQHHFDIIFAEHLTTIDTIIIENQIGPIANKMKTIQGMLSQYFIMKNNNVKIDFISASNKLKDFLPEKEKEKEKDNTNSKVDYKQRKKLGIQICLQFVDTDIRFTEWATYLHKHKKQDDLSDCFLQGMWYIKHKL